MCGCDRKSNKKKKILKTKLNDLCMLEGNVSRLLKRNATHTHGICSSGRRLKQWIWSFRKYLIISSEVLSVDVVCVCVCAGRTVCCLVNYEHDLLDLWLLGVRVLRSLLSWLVEYKNLYFLISTALCWVVK